ncbi:spore coat U domain-containing protein [Enterobacter sp. Bisph1]|uniref:Csu type fimbrial protein n=1 Tax=Enterobacter sp. Bisph1 TaxID=1274399 RepID=UPI00057C213D
MMLSGVLVPAAALAVTTQTFTVGATVAPGCSVGRDSGGVLGTLNFGTRPGVQSGRVTTSFIPNAQFSLACTPGVALTMSINGGQNFSTVRNMQRSGAMDRVPYRLYTSSTLAPNSEIGVNQAVSVTYSNSNAITLAIFGAAQLTGFSPAGTYTDQLTVTLSW